MKYLLLLGCLLISVSLSAKQKRCSTKVAHKGKFRVVRRLSKYNGCSIHVQRYQTRGRTPKQYRRYSFYESGIFMIFVATNQTKRLSTSTGSQVYYMFPRRKVPSITKTDAGHLAVITASGMKVLFSHKTGKIISTKSLIVKESSKISLRDRGGFKIKHFDGLLLDAGWAVGGMAASKPNRKSVFIDRKGNKCKVNNFEIFKYFGTGEAKLKFKKDKSLFKFMQKRCRVFKKSDYRL